MQSSNKKRITIILHLGNQMRKQITVYPSDKIKSLQSISSTLYFYRHGEKLDPDKTFQQEQVEHQTIIHAADKSRELFEFDPVYFKFLNGIIIELPVPKVWTFKKAAQVIGASNGIQPKRISLIFDGRKMDLKLAFMDEKKMINAAMITVVVNGDEPAVS